MDPELTNFIQIHDELGAVLRNRYFFGEFPELVILLLQALGLSARCQHTVICV